MLYIVCNNLKKKYLQTGILLLTFLVIFSFELIGISLYTSASRKELEAQEKFGAAIHIYVKSDFSLQADEYMKEHGSFEGFVPEQKELFIDEAFIEELSTVKHVIGYNASCGFFAQPMNFTNVQTYSGVDPKGQSADPSREVQKDYVSFDGNLNVVYADAFRKGYAVLTQGQFPDQTHPGAIIETELAEKNDLTIGDTLSMVNPNDKSLTVEIEIIGIYESQEFFEVLNTNFWGEGVFAYNPANRIYCDYDTAAKLIAEDTSITGIKVYIDSLQNMDNAAKEIKKHDLDWDDFVIENMTATQTADISKALSSVMKNAGLIIGLALVFGGILIALIVSFWSKSENRELGIYMALGGSKTKVLLIRCLYILGIMLIALLLSGIAGHFIVSIFSDKLTIHYVAGSVSETQAYRTSLPAADETLQVALTSKDMVYCALSGLFYSGIAVIGTIVDIIKKRPNDILKGEQAYD